MASEVRLRPVGPAEEGALLALARAFHAEDGHPLTERGEAAVATVARGHPLARAWLVEEETAAGREVVGYAALCLGFGIEHGGANASVDDLYLVPHARGRGLGAAVTRRLEARRPGPSGSGPWSSSSTPRPGPRGVSTGGKASPRRTGSPW